MQELHQRKISTLKIPGSGWGDLAFYEQNIHIICVSTSYSCLKNRGDLGFASGRCRICILGTRVPQTDPWSPSLKFWVSPSGDAHRSTYVATRNNIRCKISAKRRSKASCFHMHSERFRVRLWRARASLLLLAASRRSGRRGGYGL